MINLVTHGVIIVNCLIIKKITGILVPFIQVYGFYILLHGHLSPGGGFAGGAVLGVSIILYIIAFDRKLKHDMLMFIETLGTLAYIILGFIGILMGERFLSNATLSIDMGKVGNLFSGGLIVLITVAIGLKVASTLLSLFCEISKGD